MSIGTHRNYLLNQSQNMFKKYKKKYVFKYFEDALHKILRVLRFIASCVLLINKENNIVIDENTDVLYATRIIVAVVNEKIPSH